MYSDPALQWITCTSINARPVSPFRVILALVEGHYLIEEYGLELTTREIVIAVRRQQSGVLLIFPVKGSLDVSFYN